MRKPPFLIGVLLLFATATLVSCGGSKPAKPAEKKAGETTPAAAGKPGPPQAQQAEPADKPDDTSQLVTEPIVWEIGKPGGQIVFSTISPPKTFNTIVAGETSSTLVLGFIYSGLTDTDPVTTDVIPNLAKNWDLSEDGLAYTFHLREDAKWNDGKPFTADDVEFTFNELIYNESIQCPARDIFFIDGKKIEVKAIDPLTVRFALPEKFAPFLRALSQEILPKHTMKPLVDSGKFGSALSVNASPAEIIGIGPFVLDRYASGQRVILKRNPYYWKKDEQGNRLPYLDKVVIEIVNQDVELMKFRQGETDYLAVRGKDFPAVKPFEKEGNYSVYLTGTSSGSQFLFFNQNNEKGVDLNVLQKECESRGIKVGEEDKNDREQLEKALPPDVLKALKEKKGKPYVDPVKGKWFRNDQFRKAVAYAIDRRAIIDTLMNGLGVPQWSPESPASTFFWNPNVPKYPYNIAKARKVLADAGFKDTNKDGFVEDPDGHTVEFNLTTNSENMDRIKIAELIRKDMQNLGFNVHFLPLQFNMLVSSLDATYDWEAMILGLTGGPEPHFGRNVWHSSGHHHMWFPKQKKPSTGWEARIDELFDTGVKELDPQKRKVIYDEWQVIAADKLPFIYTVLPKRIDAIRNGIGNIHPTAYAGAMHDFERLYWKDENRRK